MSVRVSETAIHLEGRCLVEDAEALLVAIRQQPGLPVDMGALKRLHMAVAQVLLVLKPRIATMPDDDFLAQHVLGGRLHSDRTSE